MCGIAGIITKTFTSFVPDLEWLERIANDIGKAPLGENGATTLRDAVNFLDDRFSDLMSFAVFSAILDDVNVKKVISDLAQAFERHHDALIKLSAAGRIDLDPLIEQVRDYRWQIEEELLANAERTLTLLPKGEPKPSQRAVAWTVERVIQAIDRLEVRGRDSAGLAVQLELTEGFDPSDLPRELRDDLSVRAKEVHAGDRAACFTQSEGGLLIATFVCKTANLIGRLGDNGAALRSAIKNDVSFWNVAAHAAQVSVLAHTRWASNGIISVPNCHPVNASVSDDSDVEKAGLAAMFVLNGDVDNYSRLVADIISSRQLAIESTITTDAKIIPIVFRWLEQDRPPLERFRATARRLDGSIAVAMIDPRRPREAMLAQKGSGQGLYAAGLRDGWMFASEVYGLVSISRHFYDLDHAARGGAVARVDAEQQTLKILGIDDGEEILPVEDRLQIFSRDIYRGAFDYFLEKELRDGPSSVEKTLRGRYVKDTDTGHISFEHLPTPIWTELRDRAKKSLNRIIVIGQGTAGAAAAGIAHLIERALAQNNRCAIAVEAVRSSEFSASVHGLVMDDSLLIAVSQSGTTTDTNRAVDLARERGAFVHAIVNRRSSDLVRKADSHFFTSDGRDIEMSVASTKAFYAQIAAGKLTALCLADALGTMDPHEIAQELRELQLLPKCIQGVFAREALIAECAETYAPYSRYWAVTGSGANHIAASEIRIKLSELCYKSIPVDFTEDKKHIDLSTEPLTLVIANDLSPKIAGDIVKEVAIFRAHNGKPIVFAAEGLDTDTFRPYAERIIELPTIGGDLSFVLATVAGHLWGFHAARAIDKGAQRLKALLGLAGKAIETGSLEHAERVVTEIDAVIETMVAGIYDSSLPARHVALLARTGRQLGRMVRGKEMTTLNAALRIAIDQVKQMFEEASRPIDTIRHQAKTVTVGTSRPDDVIAIVVRNALAVLGIPEDQMHRRDRKALSAFSWLVDEVLWAEAYSIVAPKKDSKNRGIMQIVARKADDHFGAMPDLYRKPDQPRGVFRKCLAHSCVVVGMVRDNTCVLLPLFEEGSSTPSALICLSVALVPYAPKELKEVALRELGLYTEMLVEYEERLDAGGEEAIAEKIMRASPRELFFQKESESSQKHLAHGALADVDASNAWK